MSARPWTKICCIASIDEARLALDAGADAVGLVSAMPSGPGPIPEARIAEIAAALPASAESVLLTSESEPDRIASQLDRCGCRSAQLCAPLPIADLAALRALLPGRPIYPVVHVRSEDDIQRASGCAPHADAILLDSGSPDASLRELGGTGRTHDWALSRRIVEDCPAPVILAGGLTPDNVAMAIARVKPWGVDVCSGLRRDGRLDAGLLGRFLAAVRRA